VYTQRHGIVKGVVRQGWGSVALHVGLDQKYIEDSYNNAVNRTPPHWFRSECLSLITCYMLVAASLQCMS
jgi:hypothetical protein